MAATATLVERPEFTPPPTRGLLRAIGLAILAHGVLLAGLTWGVRWKREAAPTAVQAELWASVPVQAAPAVVAPVPTPTAPQPPQPVVETPVAPRADIATERDREKQRRLKAEQQREQQRQAEARRAQEARERDKAQADRQAQARREQQESARLEAQRKSNLARIAGMAGATGAPTASGNAAQSAGPSATYASKVVASIKPNIVFPDNPPGNPTTVVEVRAAPDGTIVGRRMLKPSGVRNWDEAVMKALEKTETLPRDTDGRVPPVLEISFRPRD